jgi:hypothetical protein
MCFQSVLRKSLLLVTASVVLCVLTHTVIACNGPTSEAFREQNRSIVNSYGTVSIFIFAAIVAIYFVWGRKGLPIFLIALVVAFFNPIWHFGNGSPDCGQHFAENAPYVTTALGGILLVQLVLGVSRRRAHFAATRT